MKNKRVFRTDLENHLRSQACNAEKQNTLFGSSRETISERGKIELVQQHLLQISFLRILSLQLEQVRAFSLGEGKLRRETPYFLQPHLETGEF